jgi:hypothetical protein
MKLGLLIILSISLLYGINDSPLMQTKLNGTWVGINNTDTLTFLIVSQSDYVKLDRGSEMRNGVARPKIGSGPYYYKISPGKISLRWTLSASANYNDYYFNQSGDSLVVENFYDLDSKGVKHVFKKTKMIKQRRE